MLLFPDCIQALCQHFGNHNVLQTLPFILSLMPSKKSAIRIQHKICIALVIYVVSKKILRLTTSPILFDSKSQSVKKRIHCSSNGNIDKRVDICQIKRSQSQKGKEHSVPNSVGDIKQYRKERKKIKSNWLFDFITWIHLYCIHLIRQLQVTKYNGTKFPPRE